MTRRRSGFIVVDRDHFNDDDFWIERREFSRFEAWLDLVQMAAWRDDSRKVGNVRVELSRGEFFASLRFLATRWRWTHARVSRFLKLCTAEDMLARRQRSAKGDTYVIEDYERYAAKRDTREGKTDPPAIRQRDKEKENNNSTTNTLVVEGGDDAEFWLPLRQDETNGRDVNAFGAPVHVIGGVPSYGLMPAEFHELIAQFIDVDVRAQLVKLCGWCERQQPDARPTYKGMHAFIERWLDNATSKTAVQKEIAQ